jgi:hypothetical protein
MTVINDIIYAVCYAFSPINYAISFLISFIITVTQKYFLFYQFHRNCRLPFRNFIYFQRLLMSSVGGFLMCSYAFICFIRKNGILTVFCFLTQLSTFIYFCLNSFHLHCLNLYFQLKFDYQLFLMISFLTEKYQ